MYRKLPKYVKQSTTWSCWAASMESWLALAIFGRKPSQQELINEYATHANGGLDPLGQTRSFAALADDFGIQYQVFSGQSLSMAFIEEKLQISHVLLVYNLSPGVAHANVVYGTGYPTGKEKLISVMDPSETTPDKLTGLYRNRPLSFYKQRASVLVGWRGN